MVMVVVVVVITVVAVFELLSAEVMFMDEQVSIELVTELGAVCLQNNTPVSDAVAAVDRVVERNIKPRNSVNIVRIGVGKSWEDKYSDSLQIVTEE